MMSTGSPWVFSGWTKTASHPPNQLSNASCRPCGSGKLRPWLKWFPSSATCHHAIIWPLQWKPHPFIYLQVDFKFLWGWPLNPKSNIPLGRCPKSPFKSELIPYHTWYFSASAMASFSFPSRVLRSERAFPHASFRSDSLILPESRLSSSLQPSTSAVPFVLTDSRESSWFLKSRWKAWDGESHVFVDHTHYCKSCSRIGRAIVNNDVREGIKLFSENYQLKFLALWSSNFWNWIF